MLDRGEFAEWADRARQPLRHARAHAGGRPGRGRDVLLDIDTQGAAQLGRALPAAVLIFIVAPSMAELEQRLRERRSDATPEIERRLIARARRRSRSGGEYDYLIVNRDVKEAMDQLDLDHPGRALSRDAPRSSPFPDLEVPD